MSKNRTQLAAEARAMAGKGAARAIRREKKIPAVIYGDKKEPALISLPEKELTLALKSKGFYTQLCDLDVAGQKHLVIPRDVQLNPVTDRPEHVDFLRVSDKTTVNVSVPVYVRNEKASPGVVKGGVINVVYHELDISCPASDIPSEIVVDLTGLEIGGAIHIKDIGLPASVVPDFDPETTLVTLVAPTTASEESAGDAAADGETGKDEKKS